MIFTVNIKHLQSSYRKWVDGPTAPAVAKFPTAVKAAGVMLPCIHVTLLAGWMLTGGAPWLQEGCASSSTSWASCVIFNRTCRDRNNPLKSGDMTTRSEREKAQKQNEQHQAILSKLLREDDNKYCADCQAKGKRNTHASTSNRLANTHTHTLGLQAAGSKCVCVKR